jgi:hypothetical protein
VRPSRTPCLLALLGLSIAGSPARADDACTGFVWDVSHERALFATAARALPAGRLVASSPALVPDRLYELRLSAQPDVTFAVAPGKKTLADEAFAGLALVTVETAGVYRISLDQSSWLDVAANGALIRSKDFQGRPGCKAPHKIVAFALPQGIPLVLQFSGAARPTVKVAITRPPVP